jgi:hypothetical protein
MNVFKKVVHNLTAETHELDAEVMKRQLEDAGATAVAKCNDRVPVTVFGVVRTMTIRPRAGVPALEAEVFDGTGTVTLVWLGRRTVAGIAAGRQLRATGRITVAEGRRLIYNPRYELVAVD